MTDQTANNDSLDRRVAALPRSLPPETDLWARIESEIAQPQESARPSWASSGWPLTGLAAAALLAVIVSINPANEAGINQQEWLVPVEAFDTGSLAVANLRTDMHENIAMALGELSPKARVDALSNLQRINDARNEILQALQQEPDNPFLSQLLIENYASEMSLLNRMRGITQRARQRTYL